MNTEKAIDLIDNLIGMVDDNQDSDYDTALHMAIDALKAQAERTEERTETHACDCISRQAAIDALKLDAKVFGIEPFDQGYTPFDAIITINGIPNAQPQRKGYWRHYEGYLTCSECGDEYYADIMAYCGDNVPKFCPNCGADMLKDGEVDDPV